MTKRSKSRHNQQSKDIDWKAALGCLVILAAGFFIFWPSLWSDFAGDDSLYLTDNPLLRDPARLWKAWFEPGSFTEYYPIEQTVQYIQWQLWGQNPPGYYLTNILLHIAGALLVWRFLDKFHLRLAWLGGLLFLVHPMQVDTVASISELKNTLSLPPFLLAMCAWIDYAEHRRRNDYLLALGFFLTAMLCKISMASFPLVLLLYAWWKTGRITWRDVRESLPFFALSAALGYLTIYAGDLYSHRNHTYFTSNDVVIGPPLSHLALVGTSAAFYLVHAIWPVYPLSYYPLWSVNPPAWWHLLPWLILAGIVFALWLKRKMWGRHALLGLGFFLLFLAPFLGFTSVSYMQFTWVMDHFVYLPIIGLIGLFVAALDHAGQQLPPTIRPYGIALVAALVVSLAWECHAYTGIVSDEEKLAVYTLKHNPGAWIIHEDWGRDLLMHNRIPEAVPQFEQSLQINPANPVSRYLLGEALEQQGRLPEAAAQFEQALALLPNFAEAYDEYGAVLTQMGRVPEGIASIKKSLELAPDFAQAHNNWGNALMQQGHIDEGIEQFRMALKINPNVANLHVNLGNALLQANRPADAIKEFEEALKIDPANVEAGAALEKLNQR